MPIIIRLDRVMADRKISLNELSQLVGITPANLSNLKNEKVSAVKLSTMEAICRALNCQPGDLFEYRP
jgi:putative transcriptional regulator